MKTRTLVVDASYLLKRSFNGAKDLYTNKFGHIGGLYQFFTSLRKLTKDHIINKIVLVWDGDQAGLYRHNIDPYYKANRKDKSWSKIILTEHEIAKEKVKRESILKQRKRIQAYAEELFIRQLEVPKVEADDIIAKYCLDYHDKEDIIIYTNDRDFAQLLHLDIKIIFQNLDVIIERNNFYLKFPYRYENVLPIKIICGDTADNIRGIEGIGENTLLNHFPDLAKKPMTVREICQQAAIIQKQRKENKLKPLKSLSKLLEGVNRLKMNYELMNLSEPMLNDLAIDELEQLKMPLSDEDRGSKHLLRYMNEDEFLTHYQGNFSSYVQPFYTVIAHEKKMLKIYMSKNK